MCRDEIRSVYHMALGGIVELIETENGNEEELETGRQGDGQAE